MMAASVEDLPEPVGPVTRTIPLRSCTISCNCGGKIQLLEAGNAFRDHAHDDGVAAALAENIHAKAADAGQPVGKVGRSVAFSCFAGCSLLADDVVGDQASIVGQQFLQAFELELDELAADFNLRRAARRKNQIADMTGRLEHGGDQLSSVNVALRSGGRSLRCCRLRSRLRLRSSRHLRRGSHRVWSLYV